MDSAGPNVQTPELGRQEKSLSQSESRYRRLFETAQDGILILNAEVGEVVDANPFLMDLLGYTLPELMGLKLWEIGPLKDIAASETAFAELQAKNYIRYDHLPLETKDGRRRDVEFVSNAYHVDGKRFIQCNIRDITERKKRDGERSHLAGVLDERSLNEIYFYDADTLRFAYVNEGGRRNLGYTLEQLRAMSVLNIRPEFDEASHRTMLGPLLRKEEETLVFQTKQRRADGSTYPVEVHCQLVEREGKRLVLAVALDITERLRSEQALRESEERYRLLIERSPDAIFVHCEGKIVFANPATFLLFGAERPEQVLGRGVLEIMHPDSRRIVEERLRITMAGERTPLMEHKLVRFDGAVVEVEAVGIPSLHCGKPAVQIILRDITEKKKMQAHAARNQRLDSIGSLASGMAHDLNNALAPILMISLVLQAESSQPKHTQLLKLIEESAQHAADMVKQVLMFARGTEDEKTIIEVGVLVDELSGIARHTFPQSIRMRTEVAPGIWPFTGNPTQLHQVLLNLCINARDAMPDGGTLTLTAANIPAHAVPRNGSSKGASGPHIRLSVADTGTGMTAEVQARIFEPFYTTKDSGKGTGLGLSTVRRIVEAHGGFVGVQSTIGQGTEFQVYLPVSSEGVEQPVAVQSVSHPLGHGELILVVDDEAAIRNVLTVTLEYCGYRVLAASGGPQAVELCARQNPRVDLLITDMDMPIMSGAATIMAIRAVVPDMKVIATSGTRLLGPDAGMKTQAFLSKPYSSQELLRVVHSVLHPENTDARAAS